MVTLSVFISLSGTARKSGQLAAQMDVKAGMQGAEILEMLFGKGGPKEKEGQVNGVRDGSDPVGQLLAKRLSLLTLPPEPQDESDSVVASKLPQGIIGRNGEMAEEKVSIQQQITDGRKGQRQAKLSCGGIGMSDQVGGVDTAAVGGIKAPCAPEPFGKLWWSTFKKQTKPQMSGDVKVVRKVKAVNVA